MKSIKLHLLTPFALLFLMACGSDDSSTATESKVVKPTLVLEEPTTSYGNNRTPTVRVSGVQEGAMVTLYSDSSCETQISDPEEVGSEGMVSIESHPLTDKTSDVEGQEFTFYAAEKVGEEGNPICLSESVSYVLDLVIPSIPSALSFDESSTSPGKNLTPTLTVGGVEERATVTLYSDSSCETQVSEGVQVAEGESEVSITSHALGEGTQDMVVTFYVVQTDRAGNGSACSASISYIYDVTAPAAPSALALEEPSTSPGTDSTPTLGVSGVEVGATVALYSDSSCEVQVSGVVEVAKGESAVSITSKSLEDGTYTFYAAQTDRAGNKSSCSTSVSYFLDATAPAAPSALALEEPSTSPGTDSTPTLGVSGVEVGATVALYSDSSCDTRVSDGVEVAKGESEVSITSNSLGDGTQDAAVTFYAAQTDRVGNKSACSSANVSYVYTAPRVPVSQVGLEVGSYFYDDPSSDTLEISLIYGENMTVTGSPRLELTIGSATRYASYVSGSGSATLLFRYDVSSDDYDNDGIEMGAIDLNNGTIKNSANYNAGLSFTAPHNLSRVWINFEEKIFGSGGAFAFLKRGGSVVTWGFPVHGGDPTTDIKEKLQGKVKKIFSSHAAFAALKEDGSVVTWGAAVAGGDSSGVSSHLQSHVVEVFSTNGSAQSAFAALKEDGSVVTWGDDFSGGDSSGVSSDLDGDVVEIFSTDYAFAALKKDGSVVTWGPDQAGGDSSSVSSDLEGDVAKIFSTKFHADGAFAAVKKDGSVVTWGHSNYGGNSSGVSDDLSDVEEITATSGAFAALKKDGSVVIWGDSNWGGDSSSVSSDLDEGVDKVFSTTQAFAALKNDGSVVTWGYDTHGGDSSSVSSDLQGNVIEVFSNWARFAALKDDGSVVAWGNGVQDARDIKDPPYDLLEGGVEDIFSTSTAFAALKDDGSVVTWGFKQGGGESSSVSSDLSDGVLEIFSTPFSQAFAALKEDGSVVTWGWDILGGDSSGVDLGPRW